MLQKDRDYRQRKRSKAKGEKDVDDEEPGSDADSDYDWEKDHEVMPRFLELTGQFFSAPAWPFILLFIAQQSRVH